MSDYDDVMFIPWVIPETLLMGRQQRDSHLTDDEQLSTAKISSPQPLTPPVESDIQHEDDEGPIIPESPDVCDGFKGGDAMYAEEQSTTGRFKASMPSFRCPPPRSREIGGDSDSGEDSDEVGELDQFRDSSRSGASKSLTVLFEGHRKRDREKYMHDTQVVRAAARALPMTVIDHQQEPGRECLQAHSKRPKTEWECFKELDDPAACHRSSRDNERHKLSAPNLGYLNPFSCLEVGGMKKVSKTKDQRQSSQGHLRRAMKCFDCGGQITEVTCRVYVLDSQPYSYDKIGLGKDSLCCVKSYRKQRQDRREGENIKSIEAHVLKQLNLPANDRHLRGKQARRHAAGHGQQQAEDDDLPLLITQPEVDDMNRKVHPNQPPAAKEGFWGGEFCEGCDDGCYPCERHQTDNDRRKQVLKNGFRTWRCKKHPEVEHEVPVDDDDENDPRKYVCEKCEEQPVDLYRSQEYALDHSHKQCPDCESLIKCDDCERVYHVECIRNVTEDFRKQLIEDPYSVQFSCQWCKKTKEYETRHVTHKVDVDDHLQFVNKKYGMESRGNYHFELPYVPPQETPDGRVGFITGPNGSGKSSILRQHFCVQGQIIITSPDNSRWSESKAIFSVIAGKWGVEQAEIRLYGCGMGSIPQWYKSYATLSDADKFKADVALTLDNGSVYDEFGSVLSSTIRSCRSCAASIAALVQLLRLRSVIIASPQDEIISWLQPEWVIFLDKRAFKVTCLTNPERNSDGSQDICSSNTIINITMDREISSDSQHTSQKHAPSLDFQHHAFTVDVPRVHGACPFKRPVLNIHLKALQRKGPRGGREMWMQQYQRHHYLFDRSPPNGCYWWEIVVSASWLSQPEGVGMVAIEKHRGTPYNLWREARLCVHPDWQGLGIGTQVSDTVARYVTDPVSDGGKGQQYSAVFVHDRMRRHRDRNMSGWKPTLLNGKRTDSVTSAPPMQAREGLSEYEKRLCIRQAKQNAPKSIKYHYRYVGIGGGGSAAAGSGQEAKFDASGDLSSCTEDEGHDDAEYWMDN